MGSDEVMRQVAGEVVNHHSIIHLENIIPDFE